MNPISRLINWILCNIFNYHEWDEDWVVSNFGSYRATCMHCGYIASSEGDKK